jgi:hypothetical protein
MKFELNELSDEMLNQLPKSLWESDTTTFFDPAIGGGQFVKKIEEKLIEYGHSKENIRKRVFGFEESDLHVRYAVNKHKLIGQYVKKPYDKFLEMDNTMKFDIVIGNPPYQNREENADGSLWLEFVNKGMDHLKPDGRLMFITPTSWVGKKSNTKKADWTPFTDNHVQLFKILNSQERSKYFNVGSSFGYYILKKGSGLTTILFSDGTTDSYQVTTGEPLPNELNPISFSIHKKLSSVKKINLESSFKFHSQKLKNSGSVSDSKTGAFKYTTYYSHNLIRYTLEKQDIYSEHKVMIPNVGTLANAWYDVNCNLTEDVRFIKVKDANEANIMVSLLKSKLFRYIGSNYRSGRNLGLATNFLPDITVSSNFTDQEVYSKLNLSNEEIEYIENAIK